MKARMKKVIKKIITSQFPSILYLKRMRDYTRWINNYKFDVSYEESYRGVFEQMHKRAIKNQLSDSHASPPILIMTTYNDHDIIESIIRENDKLGVEQIIIDNWSTDGTWSILEKLKDELHSVLNIIRYPFNGPTMQYCWKEMLDLKTDLSMSYKGRWIIHQDSDEVTLSPLYNFNLSETLKAIQDLGYNCISLRMLDFVPIDDTFTIGNPLTHFEYYKISDIPSYSLQNKIWLQGDDRVDLSCMGGHDVKFGNKMVFPIRLPRLHYSVRSVAHANSKYSPKRLERSESEREKLGWHTHIEKKSKEDVIHSKDDLIKFDFSDLYNTKFIWFINNEEN